MADIIVLNEITELLNSVNGSLSTSVANVKSVVDTINTNVNTVKTATAVNNTASTTGTLSQKMSSAIANTATNNTASKTGILSQKLAYVISLLENSTYGLNASKASGVMASDNVLVNVISSEKYCTMDSSWNLSGTLNYPDIYVNTCGKIRLKCSMKSGKSGTGATMEVIVKRPIYESSTSSVFTTCKIQNFETYSASYTTFTTNDFYVFPGDIISFQFGFASTNTTMYVNSFTVCGTLIGVTNNFAVTN